MHGAALPVPTGDGGSLRPTAGGTAYADVRTLRDPAAPEARRVDGLTVTAPASHRGRSFTAARLGTGRRIPVWSR